MANINLDQGVGGMRLDFETAVAHLLPYCLVAKTKTAIGNKQGADNILDVSADVASFGSKSGRGPKTGVHLCYHKFSEFKKLTPEEMEELKEWHNSPKGKASMEESRCRYKSGGGS
eukprot:4186628-Ditylum_brightwellii.AAC.1